MRYALQLGVGILVTFSLCASASATRVELHSWYSATRGDYFTTSHPAWVGTPGEVRSGYVHQRVEGLAFSPSEPQPSGTIPLYGWWSPTREDNFVTSDPNWAGSAGMVKEGYEFVRIEGYVHSIARLDTVRLYGWWNSTFEDNQATSDPDWYTDSPASIGWVSVRTEGYLDPPLTPQPPDLPEAFGAGAIDELGSRFLLVIAMDYDDHTISDADFAEIRRFFAGPGFPNVGDFFRENSYGRFEWSAVVVRVHFPGTFAQAEALGDDGLRKRALELVETDTFLDLASFDGDGDGTVEFDELRTVLVSAHPLASSWGGVHYLALQVGDVALNVGNAGVPTDQLLMSVVAKQLGRLLRLIPLGGATLVQNDTVSVMGPDHPFSLPNQSQYYHFDPLSKMRLGWIRPRVVSTWQPGGVAELFAAQSADPVEPLLFYDPSRGRDEFYLAEFRSRVSAGYDQDVARGAPVFSANEGVAFWYARVGGSLSEPVGVAGAIGAGPDGEIDTLAQGDDVEFDSTITRGPDDCLDTQTPLGDDVIFYDRSDWIVGAPPDDGFPLGYQGQPTLWTSQNVEFGMSWACEAGDKGLSIGRWFRIGPAVWDTERTLFGSGVRKASLEWGRPSVILIGGYWRYPARVDGIFCEDAACRMLRIEGSFRVYPAANHEVLLVGDSEYLAQIVSGSTNELFVLVPDGAPAGSYEVRVNLPGANGAAASSSNGVAVAVPEASAGLFAAAALASLRSLRFLAQVRHQRGRSASRRQEASR